MPRSRLVKPELEAEEPISQVLRADIRSKKQKPDDYLAGLDARWDVIEQELQKYVSVLLICGLTLLNVTGLTS